MSQEKKRKAADRNLRARKTRQEAPISNDELIALEDFLKTPALVKTAMGVSGIDGYLTALVIGPEVIMPSEYLPWIWDAEDGEASPSFESLDEANRYLDLLMRMHNRIAGELMHEVPRLAPLFVLDERWSPKDWAQGFSDAIAFDEDAWDFLASEHEDWLTAVLDVGAIEGKSRAEVIRNGLDVAQHLVSIRDYFREGSWREGLDRGRDPAPSHEPHVRGGPKIGRNDACPCGSGRKYKKCCGDAGGAIH